MGSASRALNPWSPGARPDILPPRQDLAHLEVDDQPTSASARALAPARLCFLPKADSRRIVEQHDRIGRIVNGNRLRFRVGRLQGKDKEVDLIILEDR